MAAGGHHDALKLVAAVKAGNSAALDRLQAVADAAVWPVVVAIAGDGPEGEEAYLAFITALQADGFARLGRYTGRSSLSGFLKMIAPDVLGARIASNFSLNPDRAWRGFAVLFEKRIEKAIREKFPFDSAQWDDLYQDISVRFMEDDYKRIRAYNGKDSFAGFIMVVVERLLLDIFRSKKGRRRLPASVARLPKLHQLIFIQAAWESVGTDPDRIANALLGKIKLVPSRGEIIAILDVLAEEISDYQRDQNGGEVPLPPDGSGGDIPDPTNPERELERKQREAQELRLKARIELEKLKLPDQDRLYLELVYYELNPPKAGEIASIMRIKVERAYVLGDRFKVWMEKIKKDLGITIERPSDQGRSVM